jgi:hypothetical protein
MPTANCLVLQGTAVLAGLEIIKAALSNVAGCIAASTLGRLHFLSMLARYCDECVIEKSRLHARTGEKLSQQISRFSGTPGAEGSQESGERAESLVWF